MWALKIKVAFQTFKYWFWIVIIFQNLLPSVYRTVRIYWLGEMPSDSSINIASQVQWFDCIYEVLQEGLLNPMFFLLGKSINDPHEFTNKIQGCFWLVLLFYAVMSIIVLSATPDIVKSLSGDQTQLDEIVFYIRMEAVAIFINMFLFFERRILTILESIKCLWALLILETVLSIIFDLFFISDLSCSAKLGVNGIAYSKMAVYFILDIVGFVMLLCHTHKLLSCRKPNWKWMKDYIRVGGFQIVESLLRNLSFMYMVVKITNEVGEQGTYWVANNFIWNWLLLPFSAIGEVVRTEISIDIKNVERKTIGYVLITLIILIIEICCCPSYKFFVRDVMNSDDYNKVIDVVKWVSYAYITWVFNNIIDSTFIGSGRTDFMFYQSICIDGVYYLIRFLIYKFKDSSNLSLKYVSTMFAVGMTLDLLPAVVLYIYFLKRNKLNVLNIPTSTENDKSSNADESSEIESSSRSGSSSNTSRSYDESLSNNSYSSSSTP